MRDQSWLRTSLVLAAAMSLAMTAAGAPAAVATPLSVHGAVLDARGKPLAGATRRTCAPAVPAHR